MRMNRAIIKQEQEIENLQEDVIWLLKLGDYQKAVKKQQRIDLLIKQINLVREKFLC